MRGADEGIWRRFKIIPFTVKIPEDQKDPLLPEKLKAEASGILNWIVAGCLEWQRDQLGSPPEVASATAGYREEQNMAARFFEDRCLRAPEGFTTSEDLRGAHVLWCARNGERALSPKALGDRLAKMGFKPGKEKGARGWHGFSLKPGALDGLDALRRERVHTVSNAASIRRNPSNPPETERDREQPTATTELKS